MSRGSSPSYHGRFVAPGPAFSRAGQSTTGRERSPIVPQLSLRPVGCAGTLGRRPCLHLVHQCLPFEWNKKASPATAGLPAGWRRRTPAIERSEKANPATAGLPTGWRRRTPAIRPNPSQSDLIRPINVDRDGQFAGRKAAARPHGGPRTLQANPTKSRQIQPNPT